MVVVPRYYRGRYRAPASRQPYTKRIIYLPFRYALLTAVAQLLTRRGVGWGRTGRPHKRAALK